MSAPLATELEAPAAEPGSPDRSTAPRRRRILRRVIGGVVLLALLAIVSVLPEPRTSTAPLAPDSTAENGSRAVAQILAREGVRVRHVTRLSEAVAQATEGSTLLVTDHALLYEPEVSRLVGTSADLVLVDPGYLVSEYVPEITSELSWGAGPTTTDAACSDPDALAAGTLTWGGNGFRSSSEAVALCFLGEEGAAGLARVTSGGRTVTALATGAPLRNSELTAEGNAALALRLLGANADLVWYTPDYTDLLSGETGPTRAGPSELVPGWVGFVAIQLGILTLFVALWRGRRLGRLVAEPLPVVVQSAEVTRGRGRLYRRSRSYGHAGAALRAAAASRCSARLGLPRSAGAAEVLDEISYASGRPRDEVAQLLYGPPPTSDAGLTDLARELDRLESEVHRP